MNCIQPWKFKKWDVRSDGKVFWVYNKAYTNGEYWVEWSKAMELRKMKLESDAAYRRRNPQKVKESDKKYKSSPKGRELNRKYEGCAKGLISRRNKEKIRRALDALFAMRCRMRARITKAIRDQGYSKQSKTLEMLGCSWGELMIFLSSKFVDGMSWDNRHLWHIDHIIPLASATSEEELIKLNYYTNLQPLWAADNLRKSDKILSQV
jgi:hypothetical protein